ncbi:MAG: polysaccharide deacetylase family protein, partial [Solirubrobacteraceae bacterium]
GALVAASVAWAAPALAPVVPLAAAALGVPRRLPGPHVTLTFDDGPHPRGTPAVLECLDAAGVRALFFLVGEQVQRHPGLAREIADRGHVVAVHGYRHRLALRIAPRALRADLDRAHDVIGQATGTTPDLYRPPYGVFSLATVAEVRRRGWRPLLWSHWGRDWARRATPRSVAALVLDGLGPGDVVLLHDADDYSVPGSWRATVGALDLLLPELARRGLI